MSIEPTELHITQRGPVTLEALSTNYADLLEEVRSWGISTQGRLESYGQELEALKAETGPFVLDHDERTDLWRRRTEALSQTFQLVRSRQVWSHFDQTALRALMLRARKGGILPPENAVNDDARNRVAELALATLLHDYGCSVEITQQGADVLADVPGLGPCAFECKRPLRPKKAARNVKDAADQLAKRLAGDDRLRHGFVGLALDSMVGLAGAVPVCSSESELDALLLRITQDVAHQLQDEIPFRERLHPSTDAIFIFTQAVFFIEGSHRITPASALVPITTLPESAPEQAHLRDALEALPRHERERKA